MNTTTKVIIGVTVAAAAGAAIGMLMAPEKGTDLQKKIKEGSKEWLANFFMILNAGKEIVSKFQTESQLEVQAVDSEINERRQL